MPENGISVIRWTIYRVHPKDASAGKIEGLTEGYHLWYGFGVDIFRYWRDGFPTGEG